MTATIFFTLAAVALFQSLSVFAQLTPPASNSPDEEVVSYGPGYQDPISEYDVPYGLQQILASNSSHWRYATDFTRNIVPKILHSHNDYWRDVPYYSALSVGAISVESDIWLINGTLHVGHEVSALTAGRTFESLYVNPILDTIKRQNPTTPFISGKNTKNGVFDTSSTQTLYLWLDVKTAGPSTFQAAIDALQPLRDGGYLTTYSPERGVSMSSVTVIGTGNTPQAFFSDPSKPRDYFFDAALPELGPTGSQHNITSNVTLIASTSFGSAIGSVGINGSGAYIYAFSNLLSERYGNIVRRALPYVAMLGRALWGDTILSPAQLSKLQSQISTARSKGIGARYWDTPGWPVRVRNGLWRTFFENGVALINVDDLEAAAFTNW